MDKASVAIAAPKRVLLIGDLPLGSEILKLILARGDQIRLVGVLSQKPDREFTNDPFFEKRNMRKLAQDYDIPTFDSANDLLAQFSPQELDIGINCRSSIIFSRSFIKLFRQYLLNLHGGLLPSRAGLNIACHTIIEGDSLGGGTLHLIDEKIDTGDIIARKTFPVLSTDTALDVYRKTQTCLLELVTENLDGILAGTLTPVPQSRFVEQGETARYFNRMALAPLKHIDLSRTSMERLDRIVRGCDFPGHEPAFIEFEGKRIYLTTRRFFDAE